MIESLRHLKANTIDFQINGSHDQMIQSIVPIRQITIIGTGLIGGSLGLSLKKSGFEGKIIGCESARSWQERRKLKRVDHGVSDPIQACQGSNVVVLATPVGTIIDLIERLAPHLPADALVTDVGSTKSASCVTARAESLWDALRTRFLAGHPMAGKENSGVDFAAADLFRGAVWFLTAASPAECPAWISGEYVSWLQENRRQNCRARAGEHDNSAPGSATFRNYFDGAGGDSG